MIKMFKRLVSSCTLAVAAFAAPVTFAELAETTGDIWEIFACDEFGERITRTAESSALVGGETARFMLRLLQSKKFPTRDYDSRFDLVPRNPGWTSEVLESITKFQIGIFVNGKLSAATLENVSHSSSKQGLRIFTDMIFTYKVENGDFARPIRLADKDGKMITDNSELSGELMISPVSLKDWKVVSYTSDDKTAEDREALFCYRPLAEAVELGLSGSDRPNGPDYDLSGCYFFVETLDFDETWEVGSREDHKEHEKSGTPCSCVWRTVHEKSTMTDGYAPAIKVRGQPTTAVTLYVWSDNEDAVTVTNGKPTKITVDAAGTTKTVLMQTVQISGKEEYSIPLGGVKENGKANIILSAFPDYNYTAYASIKTRLVDYLTVPVVCGAPLPPNVSVKASKSKVDVGSDYPTPALELEVSVSGLPSDLPAEGCKVTLTPSIRTMAGLDWSKYVHINDDYNAEAGNSWTREGTLDLTFTKDGNKKVYVFALGADSNTSEYTKGVQFDVAETDGKGYLTKGGSTIVYLNATAPTLSTESKTINAIAKSPVTFPLTVSDCFMNMTDTNTAYKIFYRTSEGAQWAELESGSKWKPIDGLLCKLNKDGTTVMPEEQPSYTFMLEGTYDTQFYVTAANGKASDKINPISVRVNVTKGPVISASLSLDRVNWLPNNSEFNENGSEDNAVWVKVTLEKPDASGAKLWAFLVPIGDAASYVTGSMLTNAANSAGLAIDGSAVESDLGKLVMADGTGKLLTFGVVLCKNAAYDPEQLVTGYDSKDLKFTIKNVKPTVKQVNMDSAKVKVSEEYMYYGSDKVRTTAIVSMGMYKTFTLTVNEPSEYDLVATNAADWTEAKGNDRRFYVCLTITEKGSRNPKTYKYYGDPRKFSISHQFLREGDAVATVTIKDKDMVEPDEEAEFVFYIKVDKSPSIVADVANPYDIDEDQSPQITLSFSDQSVPVLNEGSLRMKISVTNNEATVTDPLKLGYLKLGELNPWRDESGVLVPNVYEGFVNSSGQLKFRIDESDGTVLTANKGFTIHAEIVTTNINEDTGIPWNESYLPYESTYYVNNKEPTISTSLGRDNTVNTNATVVGIGDSISVTYTVADIDFDVTNGIYVQWWDSDNHNAALQIVSNKTEQTFETKFKTSGAKYVRVWIWDKDMTKPTDPTHEWNFDVEVSKMLYTVANGPTQIGNSTMSAAFAGASGSGEGHTWADAAFSSAEGFKIAWVCGLRQSANVMGWGYKAAAPGTQRLDDGNLDSDTRYQHDVPLSPNGNNGSDSVKTALSSYYEYKSAYDSYLYGWISHSSGSSQGGDAGGGSSGLTSTFQLSPEKGERGPVAAVATLPTQNANAGGSGQTTTTSYPDTYMEAIFSRELLKSDNMGDINGDGIPDAYYLVYDLVGDVGEGDADYKVYLKDLNVTDEGEPYCVEGDYLPSVDRSFYGVLIPGLSETWAKVENAFIPRVKVRGYDETDALSVNNRGTKVSALNDAPGLAGVTGVKPDRIYTNPRVDKDSTLNYVEWLAWEEFKAANPAAETSAWSPERPTNPTKKDTDGDGLTDGYEYYYWYLAHVGWIDDNGNHRRLSGRRYSPKNPGEGERISPDEVALAMDPLTPTANDTRDTDNDGLPDVLEFEIGTNPIDFDTDGDGLPDGWELAIAGLSPVTAVTHVGAITDRMLNYDGDAMAISSYVLEQGQQPVALDIEHAKRWTLAVYDENGDTDGVQWYALTEEPKLVEDAAIENWWKVVIDGVEYCSTNKPAVTANNCLATDTTLYTIAEYTPMVEEPEPTVDDTILIAKEEGEKDEPEADPVQVKGYPVLFEPGTVIDAEPVEMTEPLKVFKIDDEGIEAPNANACWIYGKGSADARKGELATSAAEYGCLALGRQLAIPGGAAICAYPSDERDVAFLHFLCYQEFGFDPRTAWSSKQPLAARWGRLVDGEVLTGVTKGGKGGYTSIPARTRDYVAYDEFLVSSFFYNNEGAWPTTLVPASAKDAPELIQLWAGLTTNPQGPNEPELTVTEDYVGRASTEGADTDLDGVPDGWELYVMAGPKRVANDGSSSYVFAPPYAGFQTAMGQVAMPESFFSPFVDAAQSADTCNFTYTGVTAESKPMNECRKFAGTDSCAYYAEYSTTIVRPEQDANWLNKFFPCDPWVADTDKDGITDGVEGAAGTGGFIYGTPADNGSLTSIPGGGLNPLSVDTDRDGLPDGWELQFKGTPGSLYAGDGVSYAKDADGNDIGNALQGLTDGMDGTVADAFTYPLGENGKYTVAAGMNQVVNRDYDRDGLENWQEYLTGTMRAWRYDDPVSPLNGIPASTYYKENEEGELVFDPEKAAEELGFADVDEFWYKTLVDASSEWYNPHFVTDTSSGAQYFSRVENVWDPNYIDKELSMGAVSGTYYWFYDRGNGKYHAEAWAKRWNEALGIDSYDAVPGMYASCSPIDPDSDHDGMDDYYEVFHGMNPLLGRSGVNAEWWSVNGSGAKNDGEGFDIVFDSLASLSGKLPQAWGTSDDEASSYKNFWQRLWEKRKESKTADVGEGEEATDKWEGAVPRGTGFDFVFYPWLTGLATADADGDGTRNQEEAIMPLIAPTTSWHHTDPTALWITDSSYSNSVVRGSYRMPIRSEKIPVDGEGFTFGDTTYLFKDFDGYVAGDSAEFIPFIPDQWGVSKTQKDMNWIASFEENEGFDSDHDGINDQDELAGKYRGKTDPIDADSPRRRQAMYFQGKDKPSILQTMPFVRENHPAGEYPDDMSFLQYTVECWVKPEGLNDATIIERALWTDQSNPADKEFLRCNFSLGIKGGKWFTKFDPNDTTMNQVSAESDIPATDDGWTHLAASYDGTLLVLYVNGVRHGQKQSGLQPAYGSSEVTVDGMAGVHALPGMNYWKDREYKLNAIVLGASFRTCQQGVKDGSALDVTRAAGWNCYTNFFKGYIDEVRVWDGARNVNEIASDMKVRYTADEAAANRAAFYKEWSKGTAVQGAYRGRYATDESGKAYSLPAELRFHWSFDTAFGAATEGAVAKVPAGFNYAGDDSDEGGRAMLTRPDGYVISWWEKVLGGYTDTIYDSKAWIVWIPNTVTHLPRFDGTTLDSVYWSEDFAGTQPGSYKFARTAEPVSFWTQYSVDGSGYGTTGSRNFFVYDQDRTNGAFSARYEFTGRHLNQSGDDMLALGGAFVKHIDNLWDEQGSSSNWEITGNDEDGDGLPTWWEKWADRKYRDDVVTGEGDISWETIVVWPDQSGTRMTAGEAYMRDLARGYHSDSTGEYLVSDDSDGNFRQRYDQDGNGIPDWWEELYGIVGSDRYADSDNDGLSNYAEYLLSEVFHFKGIRFSPINARSVDPYVLDYFYRVGELYVGEIFTDHDQVDDSWEDSYAQNFGTPLLYDAQLDADGDGWSNRSENRAGTDPSKATHAGVENSTIADYPVPLIQAGVSLPNDIEVNAPIIINAYVEGGYELPNAMWTTSAEGGVFTKEKVVGRNSVKSERYFLSPGSITPGSVNILFNDQNASTYYYKDVKVGEYIYRYVDKSVITGSDWQTVVTDRMRNDGGVIGDLVTYLDEVVGWINYETGEVVVEFDSEELADASFDVTSESSGSSSGSGGELVLDLHRAMIKFTWEAFVVSQDSRVLLYLSDADSGHIREGKNTFEAFADVNGDGVFTPGEPYGILRDVDVSWSGTSIDLELTIHSSVTPRVTLWQGKSAEEGSSGGSGSSSDSSEGGASVATDRIRTIDDIYTEIKEGIYAMNMDPVHQSNAVAKLRWMDANVIATPQIVENKDVRVRVVRWLVDGSPVWQCGVEPRVIFDKTFNPSVAKTLTEKDFLGDQIFDLDWANLSSEVVNAYGVKLMELPVAEVDYLIVVGDGVTAFMGENDTNNVIKAFSQVISRMFGTSRVKPTLVSPSATAGQTVREASPTFEWRVAEEAVKGYTAFKIQVSNATGVIYDSGIQPAPMRNASGNYIWKAPLYAGDKTKYGIYMNDAAYTWKVTMYNAKYTTDSYSDSAAYLQCVQTNGLEYGTANVAVKYYGPSLSYAGKVIRVRAYETPDFTGRPVAAGYVANPNDAEAGVASIGETVKANCRLIGIPAGTYYLQAFIDSDEDGECDPWESMGYLCGRDGATADWLDPVAMTFGTKVGPGDLATIYIEDADTDNDSLPDAWEWAKHKSLTVEGVTSATLTKTGELVVSSALAADLLALPVDDVNGGLAGRIVRSLSTSAPLAALVSGVEVGSVEFTADGQLVAKPIVEDGTLAITGFAFDAATKTVQLGVKAAVSAPAAGLESPFYTITVQPGASVTVKVLHTDTLAGEWVEVGSKTGVKIGGEGFTGDMITIEMPGIDTAGGFFKVVIEQ